MWLDKNNFTYLVRPGYLSIKIIIRTSGYYYFVTITLLKLTCDDIIKYKNKTIWQSSVWSSLSVKCTSLIMLDKLMILCTFHAALLWTVECQMKTSAVNSCYMLFVYVVSSRLVSTNWPHCHSKLYRVFLFWSRISEVSQ